MSSSIDLQEVFENRQQELEARLVRARSIAHPTAAGDEGEENWAEVIREFLPRRYEVARHRFVIDADGRMSDQQDIVIYDKLYAPTFFVLGSTEYIPVESVYAVFEVKPRLTKRNMLYAADKVRSVRQLKPNPGYFRIYTGELKQAEGERHLLGGILCHESAWSPPLGEPFERVMSELDENQILDLGCVVTGGAFYREKENLRRAGSDQGLIAFCVSLFDALQKAGNAPGVSALVYGRQLWLD